MSRFVKAKDLTSWRKGQTRKKKRDRRGRERPEREQPRRGAKPAGQPMDPRGAQTRRAPEPVEPELHDADLDLEEEPLDPDEDLGEEPPRRRRRDREDPSDRRGLKDRLHDAVTPDWQRPVDLGPNLRIQTRAGFRAAMIEVKPGLFVVAEVPVQSVEFGFGPMLLAPALMKTLGRALQGRVSAGGAERAHRPELSTQPAPKQLPGPVQDAETEGLARWLDDDVAAEIGCDCRRIRRRS